MGVLNFMLDLVLLNFVSGSSCAPDNCNPDYIGPICPPDDGQCSPDISGPGCSPDVGGCSPDDNCSPYNDCSPDY